MLLNLIARALLTLELGAGVVCAEAGAESWEDRVAVAAVIRNRVERYDRGPVPVMLAPRQFARPCGAFGDRREPTADDRLAFVVGFLGLHRFDWLDGDVLAFCTPAAARRVGSTWRRRGLRPAPESRHLAHLFWRSPE